MQIWYLPPKYLLNKLLLQEYRDISTLLEAKNLDYDNWDSYLFVRAKQIEKELSLRKLISVPASVLLNPSDFGPVKLPTFETIQNMIIRLKESWRDDMDDVEVMEKFDLLNQQTPEDVYLENNWNIEIIKREYLL